MNKDELNKLREVFHSIEDVKLSAFAANSFVSACFMHAKGEKKAAIKLLTTLFNVLGRNKRKGLFSKVLSFLPGHEAVLAEVIPSNVELSAIEIHH